MRWRDGGTLWRSIMNVRLETRLHLAFSPDKNAIATHSIRYGGPPTLRATIHAHSASDDSDSFVNPHDTSALIRDLKDDRDALQTQLAALRSELAALKADESPSDASETPAPRWLGPQFRCGAYCDKHGRTRAAYERLGRLVTSIFRDNVGFMHISIDRDEDGQESFFVSLGGQRRQPALRGTLLEAISALAEGETYRKCSLCGQHKPLRAFRKDGGLANGYRPGCRECDCKSAKRYERKRRRKLPA